MNDNPDDLSDEEVMQQIFPGSVTFKPKILCPHCGWHFKRGLTDPEGKVRELVPGMLLVCGQCLRVLLSDDKLQWRVLSAEEIKALPADTRAVIKENWKLALAVLMTEGPEPREAKQ